jgi:uridine kinase
MNKVIASGEQRQLNAVSSKIISRILSLERANNKPILIAIDGGSGSGKSLIAGIIAKQLNATLIATDDFFAAEITREGWVNRSYKERAADVINWRSLRSNVLEPLMDGMSASWQSFDFNAGIRPDGTYGIDSAVINYVPNDVIILEGAYSCRPELSDLIHLKILVDVPVQVRHKRLRKREEKEFLIQWHERWDEAEQYYFREVRPHSSFDLVIENN